MSEEFNLVKYQLGLIDTSVALGANLTIQITALGFPPFGTGTHPTEISKAQYEAIKKIILEEPQTIEVIIQGGAVADVSGLPKNTTMRIKDYDIQEEGEESDGFFKDEDGDMYQLIELIEESDNVKGD